MADMSLTDVDNIDGTFSISEFLDYIGTKLHKSVRSSHKRFLVFWDEEDDESDSYQTLFPKVGPSLLASPIIKDKTKIALQRVDLLFSLSILAQFWAPVAIRGQRYLSSSDQPFGLTCLRKGLCWYRKHSLNHLYYSNNMAGLEVINVGTRESLISTGPPSRVFFNGLPEYSPNVEFYSKTEYPMRDEAMKRKIKNYMAVPVFGPISPECIGVLELALTPGSKGEMDKPAYIFGLISTALQGVGLRSSNYTSQMEKELAKSSTGLSHALRDIHNALEEACKSHYLPFAQTWTPRPGENHSHMGDVHVLVTSSDEYYLSDIRFCLLRDTCESFQLLRGQSVVWRAFSSGNPCFCSDIAMLSIAEYSFAHVARKVLLNGSFAICLKSDDTAENIYVLELFLPFKTADPRVFLESVLLVMKKHLSGFKLASGQQLGDEMHVEVLRVSNDDKLDSFRLFHAAGGSVELPLQTFSDDGSHELGWSDLLCDSIEVNREWESLYQERLIDWPCFFKADASASQSRAVNIDLIGRKEASSDTQSGKDGSSYINSSASTSRFPDKDYELNKISITDPKVDFYDTKAGRSSESKSRLKRETIEQHFDKTLKQAADALQVSTSTLKRECRKNEIERWPRKKNKATGSTTSIEYNEGNEKHDPEYGQEGLNSNMSTEEGTTSGKQNISQVATVKSGSPMMTIKAAYGEKLIKFRLPFSSSQLVDIEMEVASKLKLKFGDFNIRYLDEEDEWILLTDDADVRAMESMGKTTIRLSITRGTDASTS